MLNLGYDYYGWVFLVSSFLWGMLKVEILEING